MLDINTKRRIDAARDILVGKVPDPKSQVEQITIALIYKFMDDMDAESEEFGGKRKFFAREFARYGWAKLMRSGLGGQEILNLYTEAIVRMPKNPGIPLLFREIFKNAYLPYRDPETLKMFLKVIDEFTYDHSERLGDAFEYLLSVLGSQGDAGQFRTPRHIIDFIVAVVDPKKHETVLDPACGTAGFLISAYKHILAANRLNMNRQDEQDDSSMSLSCPSCSSMSITSDSSCSSCPSMLVTPLTPDEKGRLAQNFKGYDISPDMVRLSLVNLYLHGFADPHIAEYDTLTSQDRWNEYADVILANPPFMSPKGGIKPHNRFSVQSKRSEVLFVDYMAEHLTPSGRAGIIVPEGIIFQSQTAYKQLRKMLVEEFLVAVVSLPAGVFNPYSGVKTSILILDKSLAKRTATIAFFKVGNDGFGLGAQRREIDKNDLPQVAAAIKEWFNTDRQDGQDKKKTSCPSCSSMLNALVERGFTIIVEKEKIAANGDYNLSGERYRESSVALKAFPFHPIRDLTVEIRAGFASGQSSVDTVGVPHVRPMNINEEGKFVPEGMKYISEEEFNEREGYALDAGDVLFNNTNSVELVGKTCLVESPLRGGFSNHMTRLRANRDRCLPHFLALVLHSAWRRGAFAQHATRWVGQAGINAKNLADFQIPLPPLEVQTEFVAEIEGYQKVINGARAVLDNYRPHIPIHPDWPMVDVRSVSERITKGTTPTTAGHTYQIQGIIFLKVESISENGTLLPDKFAFISEECHAEQLRSHLKSGDVLFSIAGALGRVALVPAEILPANTNQALSIITPDQGKIHAPYLAHALRTPQILAQAERQKTGVAQYNLSLQQVGELTLPLPPLATQQAIVAEIEAEQALVVANRDLIARFEKKIQATLARVWGEDEPAAAEA